MKTEFLTRNSTQTKKLGQILAKEILTPHQLYGGGREDAFILGLEGDLGGGKTTFLQGFARGLGIKEKILSPTFVILKKFKVKSSKFKVFYHIDCYRIQKPKEILDLGLKKIIANPQNIVAIEWAEKIKKRLPKDIINVKFEFIGKNTRKVIFSYLT